MPFDERQMNTSTAEANEKELVPAISGPWTERIVDLAAPQGGEQVLDVACGTGIAARLAATRLGGSGKVVGLDNDAAMLQVARRIAPSIEWHCASALEMPFDQASFDVALCVLGLMFFPDPARGIAEIRRVLKRSGRFVALVRGPLEFNKAEDALIVALERLGVDTATARKAYCLSDPDRLRAMSKQAGFSTVEIRTEDGLSRFPSVQAFFRAMINGAYVFRRAFALLPDDRRAEFSAHVDQILGRYVTGGTVAFPTRMHLLTARP